MNGLATDVTMVAYAGLVVSLGGLWLSCLWREQEYRRARPAKRPVSVSGLIVSPRIDRSRPQHPQLRIWDGEPWCDPRDLLWHDELDAAISRHPAGKERR